MNNNPKSRQAKIVVQELENELLIYDLSVNKAFCLNQTSMLVYQLCDGTKTVAEVSDLINKILKTQVSEDFVWLALDELKKEKLLEDDLEINFGSLSRREAVKKVGLASMIALPVIASVVAPTALLAQSTLLQFLEVCSASPQCESGNCADTFVEMRCCDSRANSTAVYPFLFVGSGCVTSCLGFEASCCSYMVSIDFENAVPACPFGTGVCRCE